MKQVKINIPLLDAIKQFSTYGKVLKDLVSEAKKIRAGLGKKVILIEQASCIVSGQSAIKRRDPGKPVIECTIGKYLVKGALLDLGANVYLLPYSVYTTLGLGELHPTTMTLQLADRSIREPLGIIKDVLVKVDKFLFPCDFVVLDMETDSSNDIPIIFGRPFLSTLNASLNFRSGDLDLVFGNHKVRINVYKTTHGPHSEEISFCDIEDGYVEDALPHALNNDNLNLFLTEVSWESYNLFENSTESMNLLAIDEDIKYLNKEKFEELPPISNKNAPFSVDSPPVVSLKTLPSTLKYVFLRKNDTLTVIISSSLNDFQEKALLKILKKHRRSFGWTMADLRGIDPSYCMHRITLEEGSKQAVKCSGG